MNARHLRLLLRRTRARLRLLLGGDKTPTIFSRVISSGVWNGIDTLSGPGSDLDQTARVRSELPLLLRRLGVRSLLDAPCGDFHWMRLAELDLERYVGVDIVPEAIERAKAFESEHRAFMVGDITAGHLPKMDAVFSRDALVHLSFRQVFAALRSFRASGARFLITTTFPDQPSNWDIQTGDWRPLNLCKAPFSFPEPLELLREDCTEFGGEYRDKSLGVWRFDALPRFPEG